MCPINITCNFYGSLQIFFVNLSLFYLCLMKHGMDLIKSLFISFLKYFASFTLILLLIVVKLYKKSIKKLLNIFMRHEFAHVSIFLFLINFFTNQLLRNVTFL